MFRTIGKIFLVMLTIYLLLITYNLRDNFYVKIVDQHGNPVPDVEIVVSSLFVILFAVDNVQDNYTSDKDGRFKIGGPRVSIRSIEKNGYEFSKELGYGSRSINMNYNRTLQNNSYYNPYNILAWKRKKPESLIGNHRSYGLKIPPRDEYLGANFLQNKIRFKYLSIDKETDKIEEILLIRYTENKDEVIKYIAKELHPWELTLTVPNGGLIETNDIFLNQAPEEGYQRIWVIRSEDLRKIGHWVEKTFYLKAKNGQVYGQFSLEFRPYIHSFSIGPYWLNINGSRNLTRPKKYAYCLPMNRRRDCVLDDFGP